MPLFFFISGLTFKYENNAWLFIKKKVKGLLVPYIMYSGIWVLWYVIKMFLGGNKLNLFTLFIGLFINIRNSDYSIGLWFMPLLFLSELFIYCILRFAKSKRNQVICVTVIYIIGLLYAAFVTKALPNGVDAVPIAATFVYVGYSFITGNGYLFLKRLKAYNGIVLLIINVILGYYNMRFIGDFVDMYYGRYGNPILFTGTAITGILLILFCCIRFNKFTWLEHIGRNTLHIYCLHQLFIEIVYKLLEKFMILGKLSITLKAILITILVICACFSWIYLLKRTILLFRTKKNHQGTGIEKEEMF